MHQWAPGAHISFFLCNKSRKLSGAIVTRYTFNEHYTLYLPVVLILLVFTIVLHLRANRNAIPLQPCHLLFPHFHSHISLHHSKTSWTWHTVYCTIKKKSLSFSFLSCVFFLIGMELISSYFCPSLSSYIWPNLREKTQFGLGLHCSFKPVRSGYEAMKLIAGRSWNFCYSL